MKTQVLGIIQCVALAVLSSKCAWADDAPDKNSATNTRSAAVDRHGDPLPHGAFRRLGTIRLRHASAVSGVTFSPDGRMLASTGWDGVRIWDFKTGRLLHQLQGTADIGALAAMFSPDGNRLTSVGEQGAVQLWEVATRKELFRTTKVWRLSR